MPADTLTWTPSSPIYGQTLSLDEIASVTGCQLLYSRTHPNNSSPDNMENVVICTHDDHWQSRVTSIHSNYQLSKPCFGSFNQEQFVAAGLGRTPGSGTLKTVILTSANGFEWQEVYTTHYLWPQRVRYSSGWCIIVLMHGILISQDLVTWTEVKIPNKLIQYYMLDAAVLNNTLVAICNSDAMNTTMIMVDLDTGVTTQRACADPDVHTLISSPDQLLLIGDHVAMYSTDALRWWPLKTSDNRSSDQIYNDAVYNLGNWYLAWTLYHSTIKNEEMILEALSGGVDIVNVSTLEYSTVISPCPELSKLNVTEHTISGINTLVENPSNFIVTLN